MPKGPLAKCSMLVFVRTCRVKNKCFYVGCALEEGHCEMFGMYSCTVVQLHQLHSYITVAVEVRAMSSSLSRIGLSLEMAAILECRLENQPDCCQPWCHGLLSTNSKACSVALCTVSTVVARCRCVSWRGAQWWRAGSEMEDWRYGVEEEELSMIPTMIHDTS